MNSSQNSISNLTISNWLISRSGLITIFRLKVGFHPQCHERCPRRSLQRAILRQGFQSFGELTHECFSCLLLLPRVPTFKKIVPFLNVGHTSYRPLVTSSGKQAGAIKTLRIPKKNGVQISGVGRIRGSLLIGD